MSTNQYRDGTGGRLRFIKSTTSIGEQWCQLNTPCNYILEEGVLLANARKTLVVFFSNKKSCDGQAKNGSPTPHLRALDNYCLPKKYPSNCGSFVRLWPSLTASQELQLPDTRYCTSTTVLYCTSKLQYPVPASTANQAYCMSTVSLCTYCNNIQ